MLGFCSGIA
jgi:hypothetical protein